MELLPHFFLAGLIVLCAAITFLKTKRSGRSLMVGSLPYVRINRLFSAAESNFLHALDKSIGDGVRIFGKVRIADVIQVSNNIDKAHKIKLFNQIACKHFDFVLCDARDNSIMLVIELDDSSHARPERFRRDVLVNDVCRAAGVALLRIPARRRYVFSELSELLMPFITNSLESKNRDKDCENQ